MRPNLEDIVSAVVHQLMSTRVSKKAWRAVPQVKQPTGSQPDEPWCWDEPEGEERG